MSIKPKLYNTFALSSGEKKLKCVNKKINRSRTSPVGAARRGGLVKFYLMIQSVKQEPFTKTQAPAAGHNASGVAANIRMQQKQLG